MQTQTHKVDFFFLSNHFRCCCWFYVGYNWNLVSKNKREREREMVWESGKVIWISYSLSSYHQNFMYFRQIHVARLILLAKTWKLQLRQLVFKFLLIAKSFIDLSLEFQNCRDLSFFNEFLIPWEVVPTKSI